MKKKSVWQAKKKIPAIKVSTQQAQQLGNKQYVQAMKHMKKFNQFQSERKIIIQPLDPECTFKPKFFTQSYKGFKKPIIPKSHRNYKKTQERLLDWGKQSTTKKIERILNQSLQIQSKVKASLNFSLEKKKESKTYTAKHLLSKTINASSIESPIKKNAYSNGLSHKQKSQTTLFSANNLKSRSSLFS